MVRVQVVVLVNKVRLLSVAVHLQSDLVVGILELRRRDQVVPLDTGAVVHSL